MTYLEWNNIIAEYFFNPANAGKETYLYLTKEDIIQLGELYITNKAEEQIWEDLTGAIKRGLPGSAGNIIAKAKYAFDKRYLRKIDNIEIKYPPYIAYLVFIVLPLIEGIENTYSANNYYDRLNRFLSNNQINETIGTNDFRNNQINSLWEDLGNWANVNNNGDLGLFKVIPFTNPNWIYVGKVFSQCVFPPKCIKRLPILFMQAGMVPDSYYSPAAIKKYLLMYGSSILQISKNTLDAIRSDSNELGQSIIDIFNREYKKWTGETHEEEEGGSTQRIKRNYTVIPLFLQFKVNENNGLISFSFRGFSSNDYPEDLKFGEHENLYERNGWSKTLELKFKESFELKDDYNKWVARFPDRNIRLFISAGTYQLSTDYWIETDTLLKTDPMYLLCRNGNRESIQEWGKSFRSGDFRMEDLDGLPENYSLYRILNPVKSHPDIPLLTLYTEKRIELTRGLKVNFRTFINDFLPEVEITNSDGNEKVYLQYKSTEEKYFLKRRQPNSNRWLLPEDVLLNVDFYIKVEDETFSGNEIAYNLVSSNNVALKIDELQLPKRDSFGKYAENNATQYCQGSNIINPCKSSIRLYSPYAPLFTSINKDVDGKISQAKFNNHCGNMLCSFLALKNNLTTEEFLERLNFIIQSIFWKGKKVSVLT